MKIKKKVSAKPETAKGNTEAELEEALEKVNKEIEENGLQSNQSTNPPKEKKKMATKKSAKKTSAKKSTKNSPVEKEVKETKTQAPGYLAKDLAAEFDIAPAELRKALRAVKADKPGASWAWPKKTDKGLVEIRKALKEHFKGQAQKAKADAKSTPKKKETTEKKSEKKTSGKKKVIRKKK